MTMKNLKQLHFDSENRYIDYSKQLEYLFKEKSLYNVNDFNSYRLVLKENRNFEELFMKNIAEERAFIYNGLNPNYMYKNKQL